MSLSSGPCGLATAFNGYPGDCAFGCAPESVGSLGRSGWSPSFDSSVVDELRLPGLAPQLARRATPAAARGFWARRARDLKQDALTPTSNGEFADRWVGNLWHLDTGNFVKRLVWKHRAWHHMRNTEGVRRLLRRLYRYQAEFAMPAVRRKGFTVSDDIASQYE